MARKEGEEKEEGMTLRRREEGRRGGVRRDDKINKGKGGKKGGSRWIE